MADLSFSISGESRAALEALARETDLTIPELLRDALDRDLFRRLREISPPRFNLNKLADDPPRKAGAA